MLFSTFGAVIAYIIFGFAGTLTVLFASRLIAGVMGGNISTAQAYIADATTPENRARGMGLIGAAFGIGFVMGPAIASGLIHPEFQAFFANMGFTSFAHWMDVNRFGLPGFFAAFLSFSSFLLVYFKLPETVDKTKQKPATTMARPTVFTTTFWRNISKQKQATGSGILYLLLFAAFLLSFGQASLYSAFPLFCEAVLDMSPEQVGIQFFYIGLIAVVVQGGLIKPLTRWFSEEKLFLTGNILMTAGLAAIALAGTISMLTFFLGVMALGHSLNLPTMSSLLSQEADPKSVGAMMGTAQGLSGLGRAIGPTWGGFLFSVSFGLPFIATAIVMLATVYVGVRLVSKHAQPRKKAVQS